MSIHVSGQEFCVMPRCEGAPHNLLEAPICSKHAMRIFAEVRDLTQREKRQVHSSVPAVIAIMSGKDAPGPHKNTKHQAGHVYFMLIEDLIKIGFSTDVERRAKALRADEVLAKMPGTRQLERQLHARFGPFWVEGEYYKPAPELLAYIDEVRAG